MKVIGVVGLGEAGVLIAAGLASSGSVSVIGYDVLLESPTAGDKLRARVHEAGVTTAESLDQLVTSTDTVVSLVTAAAAVSVAESTAPHLRSDQIYVDANSVSPATIETIARVISPSGADFIDLAIMAAVSPHGHRVPMLASGAGAATFVDQLAGAGVAVEVVGDVPGAASAVKMMRSIVLKGVEALLLECVVAAGKFNVTPQVLSSLDASFPTGTWRERVDYFTGRTAQHAARRAEEMQEASRAVLDAGLEPIMTSAAAKRLSWAAARLGERFLDSPPGGYEEVVAELKGGLRDEDR